MEQIKIATFLPDPHRQPRNLDERISGLYGSNIQLQFPFYWEPPTVEEMRATGICSKLNEACWEEHEAKDFYCKAQIASFIERLDDYGYFLFLTTHNPIIDATPSGIMTGSAVAHPEGRHIAVAPFWDMEHILHEVGHMLGLDHCGDMNCIMYQSYLHKQNRLCEHHKKSLHIRK
ncbi:matrixin family metalloprotease [Candidatus Bathyarchaeota archaeon]|nr:matrixin family metalloprotease [Candidatus Bathyarchaeota archaeon]